MNIDVNANVGQNAYSDDMFIRVHNAYRYLMNPTTRLIYNAFGISGIEAYDLAIEDYEEFEKSYAKAIDDGVDEVVKEVEQNIYNKTLILISDSMRHRVHSEYDVSTMFELAFD
jgi:DnaJ-class molecular chaperone